MPSGRCLPVPGPFCASAWSGPSTGEADAREPNPAAQRDVQVVDLGDVCGRARHGGVVVRTCRPRDVQPREHLATRQRQFDRTFAGRLDGDRGRTVAEVAARKTSSAAPAPAPTSGSADNFGYGGVAVAQHRLGNGLLEPVLRRLGRGLTPSPRPLPQEPHAGTGLQALHLRHAPGVLRRRARHRPSAHPAHPGDHQLHADVGGAGRLEMGRGGRSRLRRHVPGPARPLRRIT